jgi:hypothetical protein
VKSAAINPHYDPRVWEKHVGLFKGFDVFVPSTNEHELA